MELADKIERLDWFDWGSTEFLINFQGGFVRRGFIGEILFHITRFTGISPLTLISGISIVSYIAVLYFFIFEFKKKRLCWWLILSPFLCAFTASVIRKDYLCYLLIIGIFYLFRKSEATIRRSAAAIIICCLGMFIHEAFVFFGFPVMALLIIREGKSKWRYVLLSIVPALFLLFSYFKGNVLTVQAIIDSWNSILPEKTLSWSYYNSLGAIGWEPGETFMMHLRLNFFEGHLGWGGSIWRLLMMIVTYYFVVNFFSVFKNKSSFNNTDRANLGALLIVCLACLLPMFIFLSCDYGRIYQYAMVAAFVPFLLLRRERISTVLGRRMLLVSEKVTATLNRVLKPRKWVMIVLLLFFAEAPAWINYMGQVGNTVIGSIIRYFLKV